MNFATKHLVLTDRGFGLDKSKRDEFYEYLWNKHNNNHDNKGENYGNN